MAILAHDRRSFLARFAGGIGLAAFSSLLEADRLRAETDSLAAKPPHFPAKAKSCIFILFLGGTSQIDLFDPKPELVKLDGKPIPESFRKGVRLGQTNFDAPVMSGRFPFRRYGKCGMELSEVLPHLGSCADDLTLIRSMHHEVFDHAPGELEICTGRDIPGRPTIGSWLAYGLGSESRDLPAYVVLINGRSPKARDLNWGSGFLPANYQGVLFRTQGSPILNLKPPADITPSQHRLQLDAINKLNRLQLDSGDPELEARIASYELAFRMQTAAPELADLSKETKVTIDAYGPGDFARSLLLARRLVERGVRFVTVTHNDWDHHEGIASGIPKSVKETDQATGALLKDLKQRGLLSSTLVVGGTEFGRTAITQGKGKDPGRDHHPHGYSMWLAGGGVKGGYIHGKTDELGWRAVEDKVHVNDFHATLLHLFGLDHKKLTVRHQGTDTRLTDVAGKVVTPALV
jgi:hypothetical protein